MRTMRTKVEHGAANARLALDAYMALPGQDTDEAAAIGDLIADLLHLAQAVTGDDPDAVTPIADTAVSHYEYESDPRNADEEV